MEDVPAVSAIVKISYLREDLICCIAMSFYVHLKGAVREIGKLGSNAPFFDANHTDMVHFGLSGFYSGVLVH
jgi:hypothetical protein